jgi:hypothetical protein
MINFQLKKVSITLKCERRRRKRTVRGVFVSKAEISERRSESETLKDTIEVTGVAEIP